MRRKIKPRFTIDTKRYVATSVGDLVCTVTSDQKRIAMLGYVHSIPIYTSQRHRYVWAVFVQATKQPQDNVKNIHFVAATGGSKTIMYVSHIRPPSSYAFTNNVNCIIIIIATGQFLEQTILHTSDTLRTLSYFVNYVHWRRLRDAAGIYENNRKRFLERSIIY